MTILRLTGEYKIQMTVPPKAWPASDENAHNRQAAVLTDTATKVRETLVSWMDTHPWLFNEQTWLGHASGAGNKSGSDRPMDDALVVEGDDPAARQAARG
jgi:hypothetical protein